MYVCDLEKSNQCLHIIQDMQNHRHIDMHIRVSGDDVTG